jgi:hypothetical protein
MLITGGPSQGSGGMEPQPARCIMGALLQHWQSCAMHIDQQHVALACTARTPGGWASPPTSHDG